MSYPFFRCVCCNAQVQKAVSYEIGKIPSLLLTHKTIPLSDIFETNQTFAFCRGQGIRYNEHSYHAVVEFAAENHYNFSGAFQGYCCFCALHADFGTETFLSVGCYSCKQTQQALANFIELTKSKPGTHIAWQTHGWAALPSVILDNILRHLIGDRLPVEDGRVLVPVPDQHVD